jgi:hypothetical protein
MAASTRFAALMRSEIVCQSTSLVKNVAEDIRSPSGFLPEKVIRWNVFTTARRAELCQQAGCNSRSESDYTQLPGFTCDNRSTAVFIAYLCKVTYYLAQFFDNYEKLCKLCARYATTLHNYPVKHGKNALSQVDLGE